MRNFFSHRRKKGFTIIELMVSLTILTFLSLGTARIYLNYTASTRDLKAANLLYEEARFLMEKIVREVRLGAIDYEQYFNKNLAIPLDGDTGTYSDNYCRYDSFFYDSDGESTGLRNQEVDLALNNASIDPLTVKLVEDAHILENAGCFGIVLEKITASLGKKVSKES